ncbi:MAG: hypothetical protein ACI9AD_001710 [Nitriliruptoraceae bacterium]|jgi:hypothetical protein
MQHIATVSIVRAHHVGEILSDCWSNLVINEEGEGVISTAIAVLVLAFVGAGMWIGFQALTTSACDSVATEMSGTIGGTISCAP